MCETLDAVRLNFTPDSLLLLNVTLFIIMYGIALELRPEDFLRLIQNPRNALIGLTSQIVVLPALTLALVHVLKPCPSMALGMFLVAACPGGNISNFICMLARGNVALSVSLSAISTVTAIVVTPFNFGFWTRFYPPAAAMLREIALDPQDVFMTIILILGLPLVLGMLTTRLRPVWAAWLSPKIRVASLVIFAGYIIGALTANWDFVRQYIQYVWYLVILHNFVAYAGGYTFAAAWRLPEQDRRAISIETGIQNSGLGLVLIFSLFNGTGGMAMIAALWGIWHLITGISLAGIWSRLQPVTAHV
ncbi:MAG: bile acid:sodium symporter family protein [Bacteroidia bacterium]|nr:bile acid:sodium symporter family protein [Bacteroidia bacterium]